MTASVPRASDLRRILQAGLAPGALALGMKRTPGTAAASFTRPAGQMHLTVWVQPNKYRHEVLGSTFTVNLQVAADPEPGSAGHSGEVEMRWPRLVGRTGLVAARLLQDRAREDSLQGIALDDELREELTLIDEYSKHGLPYERSWDGSDIWCRYSTVDHLAAWAAYFAQQLPAMVATLLTSTEHSPPAER